MIRSSTRTADSNRRTLIENEKLKIKSEKFEEKIGLSQEDHLFKTTEGILTRFDF